MDSIKETQKRLKIATELVNNLKDISLGAFLAGSVAYAPNLNVTDRSDVDLVIIVPKLKNILGRLEFSLDEKNGLRDRYFEGYCVKQNIEDVPVSTHYLSEDCFDLVCKSFVSNIRVYRNRPKGGSYILRGFEGQEYNYRVKDILLDELKGVRTIVPISFVGDDRYYIGIHRDKLLSNPQIMYDPRECLTDGINKLWEVVIENMVDESNRLYGSIQSERVSVLNSLAKKDKFSQDVLKKIIGRERRHLQQFKEQFF